MLIDIRHNVNSNNRTESNDINNIVDKINTAKILNSKIMKEEMIQKIYGSIIVKRR